MSELSDSSSGTSSPYSALGANTIRLLHFHKTDSGEVVYELSTHSLDVGAVYNALSYVWGDPQEMQYSDITIRMCLEQSAHERPNPACANQNPQHGHTPQRSSSRRFQNHKIKVSSNLLEALCMLERFADIPVWIDALCINQQDDLEKSYQIPLMGSIYGAAQHVIVWLGPGTELSDMAMHALMWLGSPPVQQLPRLRKNPLLVMRTPAEARYPLTVRHVQALKEVFDTKHEFSNATWAELFELRVRRASSEEIDVWVREHDEFTTLGLPDPRSTFWRGLADVYSRKWLTRLWTVQEVVLAQDVVVCCGTRNIPWKTYVHVGASLFRSGIVQHPLLPRAFMVDLLLFYEDNAHHEVESYKLATLEDSILECCNRQVLKPVDRIYAMLGLATAEQRAAIRVDYSPDAQREYWRCYAQATRVMLTLGDRSNVIFDLALSMPRTPQLPSWCPDYSRAEEEGAYLRVPRTHNCYEDWPLMGCRADAACDAVVCIAAVKLDVVAHVSATFQGWEELVGFYMLRDRVSPRKCRSALRWLGRVLQMTKSALKDNDAAEEAFWQTLLGFMPYDNTGESDMSDGTGYINGDLEDLAQPRESLSYLRLWLAERASSTASRKSALSAEAKRQAFKIGRKLCHVWEPNTVFFTTTDGRTGYATQASCEIRCGDYLCLSPDDRCYYVLRPKAGRVRRLYELVSVAYLHGAMTQEFLRTLKQDEVDEFAIC